MRFTRYILPALLIAAPAYAGPLLPHRAVYDLALESASDRSGITGLSGRMVYEFAGSPCDGYTVTFRFVTQIDTPDVSRITDQQTTTFEEADGKAFSFVTRSYIDRQLDKELKGKATVTGDATKVEIEKPEKQDLTLDPTQFPTQHLIELIDKAKKGETFYETSLYDGSENGDQVMTTTVIIGRGAPATVDDAEADVMKEIANDPFWPVDIAYFDLADDDGEEIPSYRISFKLHESGVTRDLVMDYGDFSMTGKLVNLATFEPAKDCAQ